MDLTPAAPRQSYHKFFTETKKKEERNSSLVVDKTNDTSNGQVTLANLILRTPIKRVEEPTKDSFKNRR